MSATRAVNLDTSVLFNYVYSTLPQEIERDKGSQRLIDDESFHTVIGGKAESEFQNRCQHRYVLYQDVVSHLREPDTNIFEYEPRHRSISVSQGDRDHFRKDIQMSWYDLEKREQLSVLRRCLQDIELYQTQLVGKLVDEVYEKQDNDELLQEFRTELYIGHDCEILVDAIEISRQHSIQTLVSLDSDLTEPTTAEIVSGIIDRVFSDGVALDIVEPDDIVTDS